MSPPPAAKPKTSGPQALMVCAGLLAVFVGIPAYILLHGEKLPGAENSG